jgi:hypothetical protein
MSDKYKAHLPHIIITREMVQDFREGDHYTLRVLLDWKPWEFCPMTSVHLLRPGKGERPEHFHHRPYFRSWWKGGITRTVDGASGAAAGATEPRREVTESASLKKSLHILGFFEPWQILHRGASASCHWASRR